MKQSILESHLNLFLCFAFLDSLKMEHCFAGCWDCKCRLGSCANAPCSWHLELALDGGISLGLTHLGNEQLSHVETVVQHHHATAGSLWLA